MERKETENTYITDLDNKEIKPLKKIS